MLRTLWRLCVWTCALVGCLAGSLAVLFLAGGISAKQPPGGLESAVARRARSLAIPRVIRTRANPVPTTPDTVASGLRHFADHCAGCHANNGSGDTEMGRGLYPRAPDMRSGATQSLSDGELFYIIENGVRLTGMPAWGTGSADSEQATWKLVQFIRHLPTLTAEELMEMEHLNPKGPDEQIDPDAFLNGTDAAPQAAPKHKHD
jgi:mono/diheme cytochrome c family protein